MVRSLKQLTIFPVSPGMSQTMIYVEQFLPVDLLNTSLWTSRLSYFYLLYWRLLIWSLLPFSKDVNLAFRFWVPLLHDAWCVYWIFTCIFCCFLLRQRLFFFLRNNRVWFSRKPCVKILLGISFSLGCNGPYVVLMDLSVMLGSFDPYLFLRVLDLMKIVLDIQNPTTKTKP